MKFDEKIEKKLWKAYKTDKSIENRNKLVDFYGEIVNYIAGRLLMNKPTNIEYEDLINYGVIALIDAIDKFDTERNIKFITFASTKIKGSILDQINNFDWIPKIIRSKSRQIQTAAVELEMHLGRVATEEEIANYMNISMEQYQKILFDISGTNQLSLNESWSIGKDADEITLMETVESPSSENPEIKITKDEIKKEIAHTIKNLPEKERLVLALYYYEGLTLKEIGEVLELTESRVCQLHSQAISVVKGRLIRSFGYEKTFVHKT